MKYAVTTSSGTAALHAATEALRIGRGDEIITSPATDMGTVIVKKGNAQKAMFSCTFSKKRFLKSKFLFVQEDFVELLMLDGGKVFFTVLNGRFQTIEAKWSK